MTLPVGGGDETEEVETSSSGNTTSVSNSSQEAEAILRVAQKIAARRQQFGASQEDNKSLSPTPTGTDDEGDGEKSDSGESTPLNRSRSSSLRKETLSGTGSGCRLPTAETMSKALINILSLAFSIVVFCVFIIGSYDYFKNVEENKCALTWMYNYPYYVPIKIGSGVDEEFPMYRLYTYVEGEQALQQTSRENHRFTGIPVLFIPGNAGSYQQVRSLGSIALWKYIDAGTPFHFDFFTIDLNEEFSAIYGYALKRQVEYARQALVKIVNLYEDFHRVVLVGHSMGGVIAKAVALDEHGDVGASLSNLIFTLATPHLNPVAILDPEQDLFYYSVKKNWTKLREAEEAEANSNSTGRVSLISLAGGDRDYLVQPRLTRWTPFTDILSMTTGVPGVWASTDHLCIVWCRNLVLTVVRSLFDLVEFKQRNKYYAITDNEETRHAVLNYHFVERTSGKSYHTSPKRIGATSLPTNTEQIEVSQGLYCAPGGRRAAYLLFPMSFLEMNVTVDETKDARVIVLTTNTKDRNWILGCVVFKGGQCQHAENLSHLGKIIPHIRRRRKMADLQLSSLISKYSHLVIKMDTYSLKSCVMLETYSESQRTLSLLGGKIVTDNKIFYNLTFAPSPGSASTLGGLIFNMMAWKVEARPVENETCPESHNLLATFKHGNFEQSRFLKNESLIVRFADWNQSAASSVALLLEPTCNYSVTITFAPLETAGQFFRLLSRFLPSFMVSVILMTMYYQKDAENWSSFHVLLLSNVYHLSIFPGFLIAVALHLVPTDWPHMVEASEYSVVLPIFLYMIAYCIVLCIASGTWYTIITGGTALHSVIIRVLSTRFGSWVPRLFGNHRGFTSVTEHVTEAAFEITLTRFPLTISVLLLALSFATCGSLAIALCVVLYLVKLFKMYEDLLEDLLKAKITNVKDNLSQMNFHFCCFLLWLVVGGLNVASLLHWSRSTSVSVAPQPQWDLSMYLCLLLLPTVAILWQDFVPKMEPNLWKVHRYAFFAMGLACVLWGTHRLYVTAFLIVFNFVTLATCQLLSVIMNSLLREQPQQASASTSTTATSSPSSAERMASQIPSSSMDYSTAPTPTNIAGTSKASSPPPIPKPMVSKEDLEEEPNAT